MSAENATRREFQKIKKQALEKAKKRVAQKIAQKLATRGIARVAAASFGATGVGLIVTYAIWTIQAFAGNLMAAELIPKLELWELILWGLLGILLFFALIILIFIGIVAIAFSNPLILGAVFVKSLIGT